MTMKEAPVSRRQSVGHATMTMSDGRIRYYLVYSDEGDTLLVSPGDADSICLWAAPYPVDRHEFTTVNVRPPAVRLD